MADHADPPTRVVVADDHPLMRAGIRSVLERIPGIAIVGEAESGKAVLALIEEHRPDVAFVDISMGEMNGLDVATSVAKDYPVTKVIVISMHAHEGYVEQALRAGASGYLLKDSAIPDLQLALDAARRGDTYLSPAISRAVVRGFLDRASIAERADGGKLTPRQREILTLVARGQSTKQIARALTLSTKTVESHRAQIMQRLDIHDVAGLVKYALKIGLVPPVG